MQDLQGLKDERGIRINEVGIADFKVPLFIKSGRKKQQVLVDLKMGINLFAQNRGAHMSRFAEIAEKIRNSQLGRPLFIAGLKDLKRRMDVDYAKMEISFTYFLTKITPVSKKTCTANYECKIASEMDRDNLIWNYFEITVPIATLCPCSKAISRYGAHNQRAEILFKMKTRNFFDFEEIIRAIESKSSSELFPILKRIDEKHITEKMYENPKFVEDVVRDVALWAKNDGRITDFIVKCKSFESIHNHNAYAVIINEKKC